MAVVLRPYQQEAIDAILRALRGQPRGTGSGRVNRVAVVLPVGAGKTVVFTHPSLRDQVLTRGQRMLVLVHRDELAVQAVAKLRAVDPSASVGRVQNVWDETDADVVVASVQTLARRGRRERIRDVGLIVADEAHHYAARTFTEVLDHFGAWRGVPTVGFSATLARGDDAKLGDIWQEVVIQRDILDGIRDGWLVDVKGKTVRVDDLDLRGVKRSHGDLSERDLGDRLEAADAPGHVAAAYRELAHDRQGIAFWPTVEVAEQGAQAMTERGIAAELITGATPTPERARIYDAYQRGRVQVLNSVLVLAEGFDMPQASCAVIARPTQSAPLFVQMVGRVLRPHRLPVPGYPLKRDALVLDVVGAAERNDLATMADLSVTTAIGSLPDGVSLLEAAELQLDPAEVAESSGLKLATGRRVVSDLDLFGDRASVWLQTPMGTRFIPAGGWTVFLWPDQIPGLWALGVTPTRGRPGQATQLASGLTIDWAISQAETYARQVVASQGDAALDAAKASWRRSSQLATKAQLGMARSLGVRGIDEASTKAQASDAISVALATRALGG